MASGTESRDRLIDERGIDYTALAELDRLVGRHGIRLEAIDKPGFHQRILRSPSTGRYLADAVISHMSYGNELGLIEIKCAMNHKELKKDAVLGDLEAEDVYRRFKYCYFNDTQIAYRYHYRKKRDGTRRKDGTRR